jgi:uncharacterized integral membrane protein (TIGR00698 family)
MVTAQTVGRPTLGPGPDDDGGPGAGRVPVGGPADTRRADAAAWLAARLPGIMLSVAVAVAATAIGKLVPLIGGPVTGIVIGVLIATAVRPGPRLRPGLATAGKFVLQFAVVLLGTQLSLTEVLRVGVSSLPVMLGTLAVCLAGARLIGRALRVDGDVRTLIGVGTGICGASAIAAVTPVIGAAEADVAYAVSTIFLFNIAAVLMFPLLGHLLGMSQQGFGLFAGTAVNDMSSVVATSTTYGAAAANHAVVVKLTRTLLIIPICMSLAALRRPARGGGTPVPASPAQASQASQAGHRGIFRLVPWFLIGFLIAAAAATGGVIPHGDRSGLAQASVFLITVALSAIGLSTDVRAFRRAGARPLLLGGCLWLLVSASSLGLQALVSHI